MRRTLHAATLALALLTSGALAQATYLALEPQATLEAAEAQAAHLASHPTTVITETAPVPGYESINLQRHTYRVLVGPLEGAKLDAARADLERRGHQPELTSVDAEVEPAYQVQIGSYRSDQLAADAQAALIALGEPAFAHHARPFTFVHAGPYDTRAAADAALERIRAAGITTTPVLGTITPEHRATLEQQHERVEEAAAVEAPLDAIAQHPTPAPRPEPAPAAEATTEPEPRDLRVEATAHRPTLHPIPEPRVTVLVDSRPDYAEVIAHVTESLDALAAQARIAAQHVAERIAERAADEARRHQPTYVHVAAGKTAAQFHAPLTALEDLGQAPHVRASGGMYRLYVGPIPAHQADELRQALRQHGIATFTTQRPSGDTATLPDTETETAALTEAPVDAPIADNKDASVATTELDTEPAAHVIAEADEATSEAEETPDATAEEATWHPNAPTLGSRAELEPGTYLTARTGPLTEHQATFEDLTAAGHETAFLRAGDQVILLVGPIPEWQEDEVRTALRRQGMPALAVHHPHHTPQSAQVATAAADAPAPSNYLALEPLEGVTLDDLTAAAPDLILVGDQPLLGPLPNDELEATARALTRLAHVTFHPYPAAPAAGTADEWAQHAYDLLAHRQVQAARQAFLEARALDATHYDALFGLAVTEDQLGNTAAAEFAYQYVMGAHPERFEARFNYALRAHRETGAQAAVPHYQQALTLAANHPDATRARAHAALAAALTTANDHNGAAEHYQAAYRLTDDLDHLVARYKAQRAAGHGLDLLPELTRYELDTRDARFTALIADIYAQANQAAYALDAIDRRMRDDLTTADRVLLLNARAATHAATSDHARALADLQAAHELDHSDATTHHNLGLTLLAQGRAAQALPHLRAAVENGVTDPLARLDVAEAAYRTGDHRAALEHAQAAAEALTGQARQRALTLHAQAAHATWEYLASIPSLEELLAATPNDARLLTMAGTAYYQTGQYARAAERLEAAHNLTGDPSVNAALINAYLASQRYGDAERALRAELAATPDDADALHKLGWALLHLGNHQGAKTAWTDAAALDHTQASDDLKTVFQ